MITTSSCESLAKIQVSRYGGKRLVFIGSLVCLWLTDLARYEHGVEHGGLIDSVLRNRKKVAFVDFPEDVVQMMSFWLAHSTHTRVPCKQMLTLVINLYKV